MTTLGAIGTDASGPLLAHDGTPLAQKLAQSNRMARWRAFLLVSPLFAFLLIFFVAPILQVLMIGVTDDTVRTEMPLTTAKLAQWQPPGIPDEAVFEALVLDLRAARARQSAGRIGSYLNHHSSGARSTVVGLSRGVDSMQPPYKDAIITRDAKWGDPAFWVKIKSLSGSVTSLNYLQAADRTLDGNGKVVQVDENQRIHLFIFWRTLLLSVLITGLCLLFGFPVAYLLSSLPLRISNLLMICVLLPFWTALLVRITAWIALLQNDGVVLSALVAMGAVDPANRPQLIYNAFGTVVAMVHVLMPSMILPLYSVMKSIHPSYVRAARSMGATSFTAFWRVYFPQTIPGVAAGSLLCFILSVGYYITPALLGGQSGVLISNFIALHMQTTLNWGLAAALSGMLLAAILILYWLFNRIVGIDRLKLG